jgi:hypothetical protein
MGRMFIEVSITQKVTQWHEYLLITSGKRSTTVGGHYKRHFIFIRPGYCVGVDNI